MNIGNNQRILLTIAHVFVAILFFIISLKFSGAEAYHKMGFVAYSKWALLGILLNIGYLIPITKLARLLQTLALPLMLIAIIVNVVIYSNPKSLIFYDLLGVTLILTSFVLIVKKALNRG